MSTGCIAYYRVSTQRQGASGLGLEAQRKSVHDHASRSNLAVLSEYTEIESGRKSSRGELIKAVEDAKKHKALLVIAKIDRLARNLAFIAQLMESKVDFVAVDMPDANRLTIHIMAAIAEHEARMISERTKVALQAAKARGVKLGNPNLKTTNTERIRKADQFAANLEDTIQLFDRSGMSKVDMIRELNKIGVRTPRGGQWTVTQLQRVINRLP
jgi:DNA invertase Pin-like site-specific DNA recombinase